MFYIIYSTPPVGMLRALVAFWYQPMSFYSLADANTLPGSKKCAWGLILGGFTLSLEWMNQNDSMTKKSKSCKEQKPHASHRHECSYKGSCQQFMASTQTVVQQLQFNLGQNTFFFYFKMENFSEYNV